MSSSTPRRSRGRAVVIGLLTILLVVALAAGLFAWRAGTKADQSVARAPLMPTTTTPSPGDTAPPRTAPTRPAAAGDALNVVVVRRSADGGQATADGIALVHIDDPRSRVDVVALPPGLAVGREGVEPTPLAETYRGGGSPALVAAVEDLTQVPVDHAAELDAEGYAAMQELISSGANPVTAMDKVDTVLAHLAVDESLTTDVMQDLMMQLATSGKPTVHSFAPTGDVGTAPETQRLRASLQTDSFASY